jgi:DNA topoisomerase-1
MSAVFMFDGEDDDGPVSIKRSVPSKQEGSSGITNTSPHCQESDTVDNKKIKLKRPPVVEDDHLILSDTDSDDDTPIASRKKAAERKLKRIGSKTADDRVDSEDHKTLAARFSRVARGGASVSISSSKDKPILAKNSHASALRNPIKRPCDSNNRTTSALKKAKCSDGTSSASASAKGERRAKDDGDDNTPLARRRLTIGESSETKPPAKNNAKKTTEACQGSGGRKKWSTLVHNGVLFPPPYKPHGVKMLYNGQPVDLTPEQEEVIIIYYYTERALALLLFYDFSFVAMRLICITLMQRLGLAYFFFF